MISDFNEVSKTFWIKHDYKIYNVLSVNKI